ncbi:hypothetical protein BDP55DRAFT_640420 [Colletotrichum godetiae]|uniref:Uncharacterized protein n=1 Tax=Colletotrichum godetiae TaxID=1209918 RepID=A0AAJ0EZC0_9PEZI|nr:uncharacterized protein BDP55DRAFT_640420 [Colletotrichum godetiae]KAK1701084.1 hypothetical protein BDP55DRAFT_640420 [Colletotrichum godetiae]
MGKPPPFRLSPPTLVEFNGCTCVISSCHLTMLRSAAFPSGLKPRSQRSKKWLTATMLSCCCIGVPFRICESVRKHISVVKILVMC